MRLFGYEKIAYVEAVGKRAGRKAGKVVSREDLLRDAWGWEYLTETKTVDTHIKRLRSKIEAAGYSPKIVETVRGGGYKFRSSK